MRISIAGKICFVLLMIFSFVLLGVSTYQARLEHQMVLSLSKEEASHQMHAALAKQSIARLMHKSLTPIDRTVIQLKDGGLMILQIMNQPLSSASTTHDLLVQRAWSGENIDSQVKQGKDTLLILASPFYLNAAENSYQTESMDKGNKPVGVVSISYSLTHALGVVEQHLLITALLLCLFFGAGVLLALYIIRIQIVAPLKRISQAMERAADLRDFTSHIVIERNDELGQLSDSFNHLMKCLDERDSAQPQARPISPSR